MTDAKIEATPAAAPVHDENLKTIKEELRNLLNQRRNDRSRLIRFQRIQKKFAKILPETIKDESEEKQKIAVKQTYQLLRVFCATFNFITIDDKEADKFCIPEEFDAELQEVLTKEFFEKFSTAIKSSKEEFEKELPEKINEQVVEKFLKFVSVKQTNHIISKYEDRIKDFTEQIDSKTKERDAIQPPKPRERRNSQKRQRKNS